MPAYSPQGLFPGIPLNGGGFVPAQVMLGITAQESNMWQAARFAVPGVTANPLIGNYYGLNLYNGDPTDDWDIHWDKADCGYGITQITDGMRLAGHEKPGEKALPYQTQRAVALDFSANVAAGVRILATKWNETRAAGMQINNGDSAKLENWFFAIWDYNSGFHPSGSGPWGLGWANNPVNPHYPANRTSFLDTTYQDAAHPQDWPYPEKVLGWAGHPVEILDSPGNLVSGFRPAWWNGDGVDGPRNRTNVRPPVTQFCDASNSCQQGAKYPPNAPDVIGEPAGPCANKNSSGQYDLRCWYHQASTWKPDCATTCGNELLRFDPGYAYQDDGTAYPPRCDLSGLPANSLLVDDVPDSAVSIRPGCLKTWPNAGVFSFTFKQDAPGQYPGKIDTHQIGGGFGGHFWFTHTRSKADNGGKLEVDGNWRLNQSHNGPMKVFVALPDHGAQTNAATYVVKTASGDRTRVVQQPGDGNRWVSLGAFMFNNVPEVNLTSVTPQGDGSQDIAFDAVAFVPINGKYHENSVEADALFDENQNIDTAAPESWVGGNLSGRQTLYDWATGSADGVMSMPDCRSEAAGDCLPSHLKQTIGAWRAQVKAAGTDPVNHPTGNSIARWIGFANSYQDRPVNDRRPSSFDDDGRHKIRVKATVTFVTDPGGKIIPGSEDAIYEHRTGNTHIPKFALDFIQAVSVDYGVARPDLRYRMPNLNHHDGEWAAVNPYENGGFFPGRAYVARGKDPVSVDVSGAPSETAAVCVKAGGNAGGSIGYRPMLSQPGPVGAVSDWVDKLKANPRVPAQIRGIAGDLKSMFFENGIVPTVNKSLFALAPPIWQELNFKVCADDTVHANPLSPILLSSWMPDQYLYFNGKAIDSSGAYTNNGKAIVAGDFNTFSKLGQLHGDTANGDCGVDKGRNGNPWGIGPLSGAGTDPDTSHLCGR
ncbi:hypothetical protein D5S19_13155 [Amycolatopsis panacis]|uniref:Golvesin/Xly CBD-like domain-containing protein n=2 Tax=Amycolatopsis panacis TaxID=2340917 RepID=A0A419I5E6_9PSEU|nr:hypothetical protein D5S19_13155 [Amycolatopsis panacis]